jgi:D-alanyl-D-alanine carboxypeptidase/D-alanyl-D-alanine-endopeptidase (penicillin-binding protein 4)
MLWISAAAQAAGHHKELAHQIDSVLARPEVARSFWGMEIEELESGEVVYSHNANQLFTPASNAKLFTTAAALALIGQSYQFHTTVEAATAPDKYGRISGDIVLVGRGDPNLSGRALPYLGKTERPFPPEEALIELADQLVARGVKVIDGDVVADDSFYAYERYADGWTQDDAVWEYGAPVSALAVNDNVLFLNVQPGEKVGDRAFVTLSPFTDYFHLDNQVVTAATGGRAISLDRQPGSRRLQLWGSIPLDDPGDGIAVAVEDPADFCGRLLRDLLVRRGVVIYGGSRARHAPRIAGPQPGTNLTPVKLAEHISAPLSLDLGVINKVSQNLHAEMLLRLLGREKGSGGSIAGGLAALKGFLLQAGLKPEEFVFFDGSGLSRKSLVSPHATVTLLRYAAQQDWSAAYSASLPVAGVDGTMASRLKDLPPGATVKAKTGSHDHVNTIAGYLTTSRGERYAFSIMCNNHTFENHGASEVIDAILRAVERSRD